MYCTCCLSDEIREKYLGASGYYSCLSCGLIFQKHRDFDASRKRIVKHYQFDDPHGEVANCKQEFFESAIKKLSTKIENNCRSILDVGCGYGYFLEIARKGGWQVSGVEITAQLAELSQKKFGKEHIICGPLKNANYPDNTFHAVTLWDVLFIVGDPEEELRESLRILKPGGIIGIRIRNVLFQLIAYYAYRPFEAIGQKIGLKYPSVFHSFCFSKKSIEILLTRLGFTNIQVINSPLTRGDPYQHSKIRNIARYLKFLISFTSKFIYLVSYKKLILGPSLLVWAEKSE